MQLDKGLWRQVLRRGSQSLGKKGQVSRAAVAGQQSSCCIAGGAEVKVPLFLQAPGFISPAHPFSVWTKAYQVCLLPTSLREDAFTPTFLGVRPKSHHLAQHRQQEGKGVTAELQGIKLSPIKALAHRQAQRGWAPLQVADSYSQRDPGQILTTKEKVPKYFQVVFSWMKREENHRRTHQRDCRGW